MASTERSQKMIQANTEQVRRQGDHLTSVQAASALSLIDELRALGRAALKSDHENAVWFMRDACHAADLLLDDDCLTYRINAENCLKHMRRLFGAQAGAAS